MTTLRRQLHDILEASPDKSGPSWYFDISLTILIILNATAIILESVESIATEYADFFHYFEIFSISFFSLEYLLRVWTSVEKEKYRHPITGRIRFVFSIMAIIDFLAILPFYLILLQADLRFIRILRFFRLFRLLKLARYVSAINVMNGVIRRKKEQLLISIIFVLFMLLITSGIMYYVEHEAQPDKFSSIPETMWWGIATLTTVGYGDMYPITPLGQFLGGIIAILGIGLFALPTGILASGFSQELEKHERSVEKEE
ncbi:MAG: ion transporter [Flavobacteriales bacterium]|nr:ion transporter [Flavobacteriales bacterium]